MWGPRLLFAFYLGVPLAVLLFLLWVGCAGR